MESNTPASYKNYLPSKKIQIVIGILVLIALSYFLVPIIVAKVKNLNNPNARLTNVKISNPAGDPTARDTDGDGVLDWQEIAVGLDINSPETKPGVSDYQTFISLKQAIGPGTFDMELGQVTDTDKVSLTIYDALSKDSIANNGVSVAGTEAVTAQELYNYIEAQRATIKVYKESDFEVVENTLANNQRYGNAMRVVTQETAETKQAPTKIKEYLEGTISRDAILPILKITSEQMKILLTVPVPRAALANHVEIMNAAQGFYQVLDEHPGGADELRQMSSAALVQDYLIRATKSIGMLSIYLSIALDKDGYAQ